MKLVETGFDQLVLIEPDAFSDERGTFEEIFNQKRYAEILGPNEHFIQDNMSISKKNVLRGLHFQVPPNAQSKLVFVTNGAVFDVVVDLRTNSKTFGKYFTTELSAKNRIQLFIPKGFAHGFFSLKDETIFQYKCDQYYCKESERSIIWNDPDLDIPWPHSDPIVSQKDAQALNFSDFESMF